MTPSEQSEGGRRNKKISDWMIKKKKAAMERILP